MKLYGRYLSPFTRRVATSLHLLNLPFTHIAWSVVDDKDSIRTVNPLVRVPALELDDGSILIDSTAILDALDEQVGPEHALVPEAGNPLRRPVQQFVAYALGACEKTVSAYYERQRRPEAFRWDDWAQQCEAQAHGGLSALDEALADNRPFLVGGRITQADITAVAAYDFARQVLPATLVPEGAFPFLALHAKRLNELDAFAKTKP